jgi:hypothetical protein
MQNLEPGASELRLKSEAPGGPLRRGPDREQEDGEVRDDLAPENLGRGRLFLSFQRGGLFIGSNMASRKIECNQRCEA